MFDAKAVGEQVISSVREFVSKSIAPIVGRVDELEKRVYVLPTLKDGKDGKDGDDGKDGKDADEDQIVKRVLEAMPTPKDGENGKDGVAPAIEDIVPEVLKALPAPERGEAGKDADPVDIEAIIKEVQDGIVLPADGKSITFEDVTPTLKGMADDFFASLPAPQDGKSLTVDDIRPFFEAEQAKWALDFERRAQDVLQRAIDSTPKPKDGADGFGLDDFDVELKDDGRTFVFRFARGELVKEKEFRLPIMRDAGIWSQDKTYSSGDAATYGGSLFVAQNDEPGRPETGDGWRLAVKRGRDGKDAAPAPKPQAPIKLS